MATSRHIPAYRSPPQNRLKSRNAPSSELTNPLPAFRAVSYVTTDSDTGRLGDLGICRVKKSRGGKKKESGGVVPFDPKNKGPPSHTRPAPRHLSGSTTETSSGTTPALAIAWKEKQRVRTSPPVFPPSARPPLSRASPPSVHTLAHARTSSSVSCGCESLGCFFLDDSQYRVKKKGKELTKERIEVDSFKSSTRNPRRNGKHRPKKKWRSGTHHTVSAGPYPILVLLPVLMHLLAAAVTLLDRIQEFFDLAAEHSLRLPLVNLRVGAPKSRIQAAEGF
ncbi:hypothetical protein B0H13DRAFT_1892107 [Mycena leptocephala]|nr:hypothetical protein B0H13DRAFT_1892107 [Mycena leptocephala]